MQSGLRSMNKRKRKTVQCLCGCEQVHTSRNSVKRTQRSNKNLILVHKMCINNGNNVSKEKKTPVCKESLKPIIKEVKVILTPINLEKIQSKTKNFSLTPVQGIFKLPQIKLRERKAIKYFESSLDSTKSEDEHKEVINNKLKRIPVYKKQLPQENIKKQKRDQYEFDSDSEKNRKRQKLDDSSFGYKVRKNKKPKNNQKAKKPKRVTKKKFINEQINTEKSLKQAEPIEGKEKAEMTEIEPSVANNFDFCEFNEGTPLKNNKVKILSDIQLLKPRSELNISIASPSYFKDGKPNANSSMIVPPKVLTPWRFNDINITRNPHFISIKDSSLPRIDQELVLNHTIVDKLNNSGKGGKENEVQKSLRQSKINDFMTCKEADKENKENSRLSLFDIDQFSPIKSRDQVLNNVDSVKRRILGEKHDNNQISAARSLQEITLTKSPPSHDYSIDNNTAFGFTSSGDESPTKSRSGKPFRLSIMTDRKYDRKPKKYFRKEESFVYSSTEEEESEDSDSDVENRQIKLFDDFASTQEVIEKQEEKTGIIKKARRRKRLEKKQRDIRTKEEEDEAEKWAAAFNSMCEEIEQFPLEIE